MGTFMIYAIVVTILYLLYMTVTIAVDLYGKKGQRKDDSELIIASEDGGDDEETAHVVSETDGGYAIGQDNLEPPVEGHDLEEEGTDTGNVDESGEPENEEDEEEVEQAEQPVEDDPDDTLLFEESLAEQTTYENMMREMNERLEPTVPSFQHQYTSEEFAFIIAQPMNKATKIMRTILKA